MKRALFAGAVVSGLLGASCLLVSSFDRFDADAPDLSVADAIVMPVPGDASGPFTIRVEAPAVIDGPKPAAIVIHITRTTPVPLRVRLSLPAGTVIAPSQQVETDATTKDVSFTVDVALGPRGKVMGSVRVETLDGATAQTDAFEYRTTGPGDLDTTFGVGGVVVIPLRTFSKPSLWGLAVDADAVVLTGHIWPQLGSNIWTLSRLSSAGGDPAFADGGVLEDPVGPDSNEAHGAMMLGNEIWASGSLRPPGGGENYDVIVRRYSRSGVLAGSTTVGLGNASPPATLMAPASDGAWVAYWGYKETIVAKLDTSGALALAPKHSPMNLGIGVFIGTTTATGVDEAPGDLRVVGGRLVHALPVFSTQAALRPARVVAYSTSSGTAGTLDPTFGDQGIAEETGITADDLHLALGLVARKDDSLVVVGGASSKVNPFIDGVHNQMLVLSLSKDGVHDASVANPLRACHGTLFNGVLDAAGRVVVVGHYGGLASSDSVHNLALVRLRPDGAIDPSFGSGGKGGTDCGPPPGVLVPGFGAFSSTDARRVAIDGAGRILVAGRGTRTKPSGGPEYVWFVARFRP